MCLFQHDTFAKGTAIFGAHVVRRIDGWQQTGKLQVGVHGEKVASQVLRAFGVLQDACHEGVGIRGWRRTSLCFCVVVVVVVAFFMLVCLLSRAIFGRIRIPPSIIPMIIAVSILVEIVASRSSSLAAVVVGELIIKHNDFIYVVNASRSCNLTGNLGLELARLAIGHDATRDSHADRGDARLTSARYLFHDASKSVLLLLFGAVGKSTGTRILAATTKATKTTTTTTTNAVLRSSLAAL